MNEPKSVFQFLRIFPWVVDDQVVLHWCQMLTILIRHFGREKNLLVVQRPHEHIFHHVAIAGLYAYPHLDHSGIDQDFEFFIFNRSRNHSTDEKGYIEVLSVFRREISDQR